MYVVSMCFCTGGMDQNQILMSNKLLAVSVYEQLTTKCLRETIVKIFNYQSLAGLTGGGESEMTDAEKKEMQKKRYGQLLRSVPHV